MHAAENHPPRNQSPFLKIANEMARVAPARQGTVAPSGHSQRFDGHWDESASSKADWKKFKKMPKRTFEICNGGGIVSRNDTCIRNGLVPIRRRR